MTVRDPVGPPTGLINDSRAMRGYSCHSQPIAVANVRCSWPPHGNHHNIDMGLRVVCNARRDP